MPVLNYPGPYQLWIYYTTAIGTVTIQHVQKLNLDIDVAPDPGDAFSTITPVYRAGVTPDTLNLVVDVWVNSMKTLYASGGGLNTIDRAELWSIAPLSSDGTFISSYPINVTGTSGSGIVSANQDILTFRTTAGGVMKVVFMETVNLVGITDTGAFASAGEEALAVGLEAGDFPFIGRDGGYPFARIGRYPGQNERLFKLRNR